MANLICGYNCINMTLPYGWKTTRLSAVLNKDIEKLKSIIDNNLMVLDDIIRYNALHNYRIWRITPGVIPFLSQVDMIKIIKETDMLTRPCVVNTLTSIRGKVKKNDMIISIHPGQYNVLNSKNPNTVKDTIRELEMQAKFIKMIGGSVMVIHIGGRFEDKEVSLKRTIEVTNTKLSPLVKSMLLFENDDKIYTAEDTVRVAKETGCGWVFDHHHNRINPSNNLEELIRSMNPTKYYVTDGYPNRTTSNKHGEYISRETMLEFNELLDKCGIKEANVMFESVLKDKSVEAVMYPQNNGVWCIK